MPDAILWFRRDLRLADNPALSAAKQYAGDGEVMALFILDPLLLDRSGEARKTFMFRCLRELDESLDGRLVIRKGNPAVVLPKIAGDTRVFAMNDFGPYGSSRDEAVRSAGVDLESVDTPYAVAPGSLRTGGGTPFKVFTPFSRAWSAHGWDSPVPSERLKVNWAKEQSDDIPAEPKGFDADLPDAGEKGAHKRLKWFLDGPVKDYKTARDLPGLDGTSRLSAALRWGLLHPRTVLAKLGNSEGERVFRNEICWRDFYGEVLALNPESAREDLYPLGSMRYDTGKKADEKFDAWAKGQTGFPVVDAAMRQLVAQGWMHNRMRMITASFLIKDLHLWWRDGARFFMQHLVDGDIASNQHGWQWVAGTGTDAAPYFRVFNPTTQGQKFDPDGDYIRQWVPELAHLPNERIHEPYAPPKGRKKAAAPANAGGSLFDEPLNYPKPMVDHAAERDETLARYKSR